MSAQNQESQPNGRTPGGSLATPQKLAQEVRDSPYFYIGSTLPPQPMWTNPSSRSRSRTSSCSRATGHHLRIDRSTVNPKPKRVGPTGRTPGESPATPQKLAQEVRDSLTFMLVQLSPHNQCGTNPNNLPRHTLVPLITDRAHTTVH